MIIIIFTTREEFCACFAINTVAKQSCIYTHYTYNINIHVYIIYIYCNIYITYRKLLNILYDFRDRRKEKESES